ncbi:SDR family oxidoreductase [Nocardia sp. SYP-A9097]|uniref:SDR family oxidoreductase n=1 Tax=Nocardia sp. SYP-A9097 TaxID=2663237 RepID=UPI00129A4C78|nr:SDR family oxidoreductase [Nocardia sp. SYP-A9097]MRH93462.1 SDR family oxidoreductase [Nocardia sp. SYP-A9097]
MSLAGQHIAVLGGTSGIGFAVAASAAEQGAEVTIVSSRPVNVERALAELPSGTAGLTADLTDGDQVRNLFAAIGALDHLVYTAGEALLFAPLAELDIAAARKFFELRYFGVLTAVQAAASRLRPDGSIILTTGTARPRPVPGSAVPSSLCGAMEALTRALAVELAPIRVNAVMPGVVRSPLWNLPEDVLAEFYRDTAESAPLRRVGEVEDIARAYLYLLEQPHATGTVLTVDGGAVLA